MYDELAAITRLRAGRSKVRGCLKCIRLREFVFYLWRETKEGLGFSERTDSEFAEFLLRHPR